MANIGSLAVQLSLNAVGFTAGLAGAGQSARGFAAAVEGTLGGALGTLNVALSALKAPLDYIRGGIDDVAAVGKEARRLGTSTEFLSTVQFAAGRSGDEMGHVLERLNRNLGEAAGKGGEAGGALADMGLDANELAHGGLESAFGKIADKIRSMDTQAEKAAAAVALFGREGQVLLPILEKGSEGLAEAARNGETFGMIVHGIDATQAVAASRAMDDIGKTFQGLQRSLAIEFAPLIKEVADRFKGWLESVGGIRGAVRQMTDTLVEGLDKAVDLMASLAKQAIAMNENMQRGAIAYGQITGQLGGGAAKVLGEGVTATAAKNMADLDAAVKGAHDALKAFKDNADSLAKGGGWRSLLLNVAGAVGAPGGKGTPLSAFLGGVGGEVAGHLADAITAKFLDVSEGQTHAPGALLGGSVAAHAAEVEFERGGRQQTQEKIEDHLRRMQDMAAQQLDIWRQVIQVAGQQNP